MRIEAVIARVSGVDARQVSDWIARGWVLPGGAAPDWVFEEVDVARVRLVRDLRLDAGVEEDSLGLVLSLLDQVYSLRCRMSALLSALQEQPEPVRRAILARLER